MLSSEGSFERELKGGETAKESFKNYNLLEYIMNKKGEFIVIGAFILIILTGLGVFAVYNASNNLYVGNSETKEYVNYFKCESIAKQIPENVTIVFKSQEQAINSGYNATIGCI